ncbi:hypothetical protein A2U01_0049611 [Trifolium medium]|uniref:Uncharacterized protein n=1 Tax=Trifolium medium TaxID=97028 RepID=A0A392QXV2_9FABA|nr:hypothetical protein [Trifolium medium]
MKMLKEEEFDLLIHYAAKRGKEMDLDMIHVVNGREVQVVQIERKVMEKKGKDPGMIRGEHDGWFLEERLVGMMMVMSHDGCGGCWWGKEERENVVVRTWRGKEMIHGGCGDDGGC